MESWEDIREVENCAQSMDKVLARDHHIILLHRFHVLVGFFGYVLPETKDCDLRRQWVLLQLLPPRFRGLDIFRYMLIRTKPFKLIDSMELD